MLSRIARGLSLLGVAFVTLALFAVPNLAQVGSGLNGTDSPMVVPDRTPDEITCTIEVNGKTGVVVVPENAAVRVEMFNKDWGLEGEPGSAEIAWCLEIRLGEAYLLVPVLGRDYVDVRLPALSDYCWEYVYEFKGMVPGGESHNTVAVVVLDRGSTDGTGDGPGGIAHKRVGEPYRIPKN